MIRLRSCSEDDTFNIGRDIGKKLKKGDIIACFGDLGSGKTAMTRGIASHFNAEGVHSPTFTLVNEYEGDIKIYHFDAYRINSNDWLDAGFDEYIFSDGICIVEWAENVDGVLPHNAIRITLSRNGVLGDNCRDITIEGDAF